MDPQQKCLKEAFDNNVFYLIMGCSMSVFGAKSKISLSCVESSQEIPVIDFLIGSTLYLFVKVMTLLVLSAFQLLK